MAYRRIFIIKESMFYHGINRTQSLRIKTHSPSGVGLIFSSKTGKFWLDRINTNIGGDIIVDLKRKRVS